MTIQERFAEFHCDHPEVYKKLLQLASQAKTTGLTKYGIKAIWELIRWHFQIESGMGEDFKLNNDYSSRYARLAVQDYPDLRGFFELRRLRTR